MFIERGIFNKTRLVIPLYRIIDINSYKNIFGYGYISVLDKNKEVYLHYIDEPLSEFNLLLEAWRKARLSKELLYAEIT